MPAERPARDHLTRRVLAGAAALFFAFFMLIGFGALDALTDDRAGWLGLGLTALALAVAAA